MISPLPVTSMSSHNDQPTLGEPDASGPGPASPGDRRSASADADPVSPLPVTSVYLPTAAACAEALSALAAVAPSMHAQAVELPSDHYEAVLQSPPLAGQDQGRVQVHGRRLCRGTLTYAQALAIARGGHVLGVRVIPETGRITTDCRYGLGFTVGYARARWAGASDEQAIAQGLAWQIATHEDGRPAEVGMLIGARLRADADRAAAIGSAAGGIARSPAGRSTMDAVLGAAKSLTGHAPSVLAGAPMRANPLVSTLAVVVNLDLYRAALARSISWRQFTNNLVVKTSGAVTAAGGWVTGVAAGAVVGGPIGALIGGLLGAAGGGTAGAALAKQVADRILPEDAKVLMAIVREVSETVAWEQLLVDAEVEALATCLTRQVTPAWLRTLYRAGREADGGTWQEARVREFAAREIGHWCQAIVARRPAIAPPSPQRVAAVLASLQAGPDRGQADSDRAREQQGHE